MDYEKIAEAFAKRGLVPSLHFHDVHNNNIQNYYAAEQRDETIKDEYQTMRKPGRPKATDKPLSFYVCPGVDAEQLKTEMIQYLNLSSGTAEELAQLEKTLIDEHKIKAPIPYMLLKAEFGELIACARQNLNRSEMALNLRR